MGDQLFTVCIVVIYTAVRLVASPLYEALLSSLIFAAALLVALRFTGQGKWESSVAWFSAHKGTSVLLLFVVIALVVLAFNQKERSFTQLVGDVLLIAAWCWAFSAIGAKFESAWFK